MYMYSMGFLPMQPIYIIESFSTGVISMDYKFWDGEGMVQNSKVLNNLDRK